MQQKWATMQDCLRFIVIVNLNNKLLLTLHVFYNAPKTFSWLTATKRVFWINNWLVTWDIHVFWRIHSDKCVVHHAYYCTVYARKTVCGHSFNRRKMTALSAWITWSYMRIERYPSFNSARQCKQLQTIVTWFLLISSDLHHLLFLHIFFGPHSKLVTFTYMYTHMYVVYMTARAFRQYFLTRCFFEGFDIGDIINPSECCCTCIHYALY